MMFISARDKVYKVTNRLGALDLTVMEPDILASVCPAVQSRIIFSYYQHDKIAGFTNLQSADSHC